MCVCVSLTFHSTFHSRHQIPNINHIHCLTPSRGIGWSPGELLALLCEDVLNARSKLELKLFIYFQLSINNAPGGDAIECEENSLTPVRRGVMVAQPD